MKWAEGYYAGLVNDRDNPHPLFSLARFSWALGNAAGVEIHLATVEAVYLRHADEEARQKVGALHG